VGISNLRKRLPPLGTLAAFEAAARLRTFTRAAEELNLTQAAVSRQIRLLEQDLGVQLFKRRRHDVILTYEGERFAAKVGPALQIIGDAADFLKSRYAEDLTICSEICFAAHWLMPRLSGFQLKHPQLNLRIITSSRPIDSETEEFDLALAYGRAGSRRVYSHPLADDEIVAVCSPSVRARIAPERLDEMLERENLIHFRHQEGNWMDWERFLAHFGATPNKVPKLVFNTYNSALDAAMTGNGVMLGWRRSVERPLADGRLVAVEALAVPSPDPISAHVPRDKSRSVPVDAFLNWIRDEMNS